MDQDVIETTTGPVFDPGFKTWGLIRRKHIERVKHFANIQFFSVVLFLFSDPFNEIIDSIFRVIHYRNDG